MTATTTHDGRSAAAYAVQRVLERQTFVADTLSELRATGLAARDWGLASEIATGTLRHIYTIEALLPKLATFDAHRTPAGLKALLYSAVYQLLWMPHLPEFAIVNEAVRLASQRGKRKQVGMVNAVLRRVTGAIEQREADWDKHSATLVRTSWSDACALKVAWLPDDTDRSAWLAAAAGERRERVAQLVARFGSDEAESVLWALQDRPALVLQHNPRVVEASEFTEFIAQHGGACDTALGGVLMGFLPASAPVIQTPLFSRGGAYVQDSTARRAALAARVQPNERVLDLCAAPGGKTVGLAIDQDDRGEVVAADLEASRLIQVAANADRLGLSSIRTHLLGSHGEVDGLEGTFDVALVDVPCSNTGVIARRPEARLGFTLDKLNSLLALQAKILARATSKVRTGGRLIYSTCCIEPEENAQMITRFCDENPNWRVRSSEQILPATGPRNVDWRDGGFVGVLEHSG